MTIRNLDKLLNPASVAVIGASQRPDSIGSVLLRNLVDAGFRGPVWPVNPHHRDVHGITCYPSVAALPGTPELAVIATPATSTPGLVTELGARGTRAVVVISATSDPGGGVRSALLDAARPYMLRIVGPNCLGVMVPSCGLNASFSHLPPLRGRLAFVTQSGAIVTSMIDWANQRDIGFSRIVSLGDMSDVDFGDMLDYLANDPDTDAILLYIEAVTGARKFVSAARAAARSKPVIVVKGGRSASGARAAATHTGALIGQDAVFDAVFQRTGMVRVYSLQELFDAAETLSHIKRISGERLAILSNGGGLGVLAADALASAHGTLATLGDVTIAALDALLPPNWSRANPVDIIGDADPARYARACAIVAADPGVDALLAVHCPTAVCPGIAAAEAVVTALADPRRSLLLTSWVGGATAELARRRFDAAGIPRYATPEEAIAGFMYAVSHQRGQRILMETPAATPERPLPERVKAQVIISAAIARGREWLSAPDTRAVLDAYGIAMVSVEAAATPDEAAVLAERFGGHVALKILSPDLPHKTDIGGVVLDLAGAEAVRASAVAMQARIRECMPLARIDGFTVEPMVPRHGAYELIIGMSVDAQFGPVMAFGHGGTAVEIIDDRALGLPPLSLHLAQNMIARTRIARLLGGARGMPAAHLEAIGMALVNLSQLVCDIADISAIDINPLLANAHGVIALDARIRIAAAGVTGGQRLAIRPYPDELEEDIQLDDGRVLWLRPIKPEDEPALQRSFAMLTPEEIYLRFFTPLKTLSHVMAARFTQIDYDREMTLILTEHGLAGSREFYGSVGIICDPDMQRAEYAILVRHDMAGQGLGTLLMLRIIAYARRRGVGEIFGEVLHQNSVMLDVCKSLGFEMRTDPRDPSVIQVRLSLR